MSCISAVGATWLTSCVAGAGVFQAAGVISYLQAVDICHRGGSPRGNMQEEIFQNKVPLFPASVCRLPFLVPGREKPAAKLGTSSQQGARGTMWHKPPAVPNRSTPAVLPRQRCQAGVGDGGELWSTAGVVAQG